MKLTKGATGYLPDGTEVEIEHVFDEGFLVRRIYSRDYNEEPIYDTIIVDQVFGEPPVVKKHKAIEELDKVLEDRHRAMQALEQKKLRIERDIAAGSSIAHKHKALAFIDAFLENRIEYLVTVTSWGPIELDTFQEAMKTEGKFTSGFRLLSLYGDSRGDLSWRLSRYTNEEGDPVEVFPFFDKASAIAFLIDKVKELCGLMIKDLNLTRLERLGQSLDKLNRQHSLKLDITEEAKAVLANIKKTELTARRKRMQEELESLNQQLKNIS